jgi:hypothetical protein
MAKNYNRIIGTASAELFDGTLSMAESLVSTYDYLSIQDSLASFPELKGTVVFDAGDTGVTATVEVATKVVDEPYEITVTVTGVATADGNITLALFGATPVEIAVLTTDLVDGIATKIAAKTFTGFTDSATDAVVTITQADTGGTILLVKIDDNYKNAYKNTYIAEVDELEDYNTNSFIDVYSKAIFEKYYIEVVE